MGARPRARRSLDGRRSASRSKLRSTTILERGRAEPSFVDGPDEDVHSFVERQLVERLGDAGRRLCTPDDRGTSRSRSTCVSTSGGAFRLLQQAVARADRRAARRRRSRQAMR